MARSTTARTQQEVREFARTIGAPPPRAVEAPAVAARDLTRVYGSGGSLVHALRGVSLEVPRGQFLAVMGPPGSGKTTLIRLLAGLDSPTAGSVRVAGLIAGRPTVLFADEPMSDPAALRDAADMHGQAAVMVTGDARAASVADRVVFLAGGLVVDDLYGASADQILDAMNEAAAR